MGHKSHPIGLRLGVHRKWKSSWFFESKNYPKFIHLNLNIEKFFKGYLYFYGIKTLLLKIQLIKLASNQLFIFVFYYRFRKKLKKFRYKWRLKKWRENLEQYFFINNIYKNFSYSKHYLKQSRHIDLKQFLIKENKKNYLKKFLLHTKNLNLYSLLYNNFFIKVIKNFQHNILFLLKSSFFFTKLKNILKIKKNFLKILKNFFKNKNIVKQLQIKHKVIKYLFLQNCYNIFAIKRKLNQNIFNKTLSNQESFHFTYKKYIYLLCLINNNLFHKKKKKLFFFQNILKKKFLLNYQKKILKKKKFNRPSVFSKKNIFYNFKNIKTFLTKITNLKIKLIFINAFSFTKFFYMIPKKKKKKEKKKERFNVFKIQKLMLSKYKYHAIFIKDFIHLTFINVLLKNPLSIVNFIAEQFKRLPKNRKQLKLLTFINQSLKILCQQRKEFSGFKFQIKGRLNRRNRTHKWNFQKGILPIQTYDTRVEYAYTEGFTRSGLIGIKLWFFYKKNFKKILKQKLLEYLYYSKYKNILNLELPKIQTNKIWKPKLFKNVKAKSKKISKKQ